MKVLIAVCVITCAVACKEKKESLRIGIGEVTESVYASGKVKAMGQYNVYATVNGVLEDVLLNEGDKVLKGQTIFKLDNITSGLNAENARIAFELIAENNRKGSYMLQEIELSVSKAFEQLMLDSSLYFRQQKLWNENVGTYLELEQRKLAYNNSLNNYRSAKSRLSQIRLQLQNELERAGLNYDINKKIYNDYAIKSAIDGKIYDILKERGELVTPQTPLAIIGMADSFLLELEVDENDILKVSKGQKVLITMDSYKGVLLEAVINKIYPMMNERTRTFLVEAHFIYPPEKLFPNLSLEANIIIQTKKNVITIPNSYIIDGKYVLDGNGKRREIVTGMKNYQTTEVVEGLKPDETIYKP